MGVSAEVINHERKDKIGTYGNLSFRLSNKNSSFYITGRNVHKGHLKTSDICAIIDVDFTKEDSIYAKVSYQGMIKPSIDSAIHAAIYNETDCTHIVHIHTNKVFLGYPLTDYNYPCGSGEEKEAILNFILENKTHQIIQLYKHGLIILGHSFSECSHLIDKLFKFTPYIDYDKKDFLYIKDMEII